MKSYLKEAKGRPKKLAAQFHNKVIVKVRQGHWQLASLAFFTPRKRASVGM